MVAVGLVPEVAPTTCRNQWRRDARVPGLSATLCSDDTHADLSLPPYCGSWEAFSLGCQPGSYESAPCVTWSVLGSPPLRSFHIARWPTPRLLGDAKRWCCFGRHTLPSRMVALITQSYPEAFEVTLSTEWEQQRNGA